MTLNIASIKDTLCKSLCAEVVIHERSDGRLFVETPFVFGDGDVYSMYIEELENDVLRVTDAGHTLMRISYGMDVDKLREGSRGRLFSKLILDSGVTESDGELYIDTNANDIGGNVLRLGNLITRITDLTFLSRTRVESTFYEDVFEALSKIVPVEKITKDYICEGLPEASNYPIDYKIEGKTEPLFVFGVPSRDKTQLVTIILQHLLAAKVSFESLIVFSNQEDIPRPHLARLSNVGGEMVSSLDAFDELERKVKKRAA